MPTKLIAVVEAPLHTTWSDGSFTLGVGFTVYQAVIYVASRAVSKITFDWVLDPFAVMLSLGSILLVGILSGMLPALKAERLSVIDALRSE